MSEAIFPALESPGSQTQVHLCWWDSLVHDEQGENAVALKAFPTSALYLSSLLWKSDVFLFFVFFILVCLWNIWCVPVFAGFSTSPCPLLSCSGSEKMHSNCFFTWAGPFSGESLLTNLCLYNHVNESACQSDYLLSVFCFVSGGIFIVFFFNCCFFQIEKASVVFWKLSLASFPRYH